MVVYSIMNASVPPHACYIFGIIFITHPKLKYWKEERWIERGEIDDNLLWEQDHSNPREEKNAQAVRDSRHKTLQLWLRLTVAAVNHHLWCFNLLSQSNVWMHLLHGTMIQHTTVTKQYSCNWSSFLSVEGMLVSWKLY